MKKNEMKLFTPLKIGNLTVKNRIETAPMGPSIQTSVKNLTYVAQKAQGGAGIVCLGEVLVHGKTGMCHADNFCLDDENCATNIKEFTDRIHRYGALASIELVHSGRRANPKYLPEGKVYGPSAGDGVYQNPVYELDEAMIQEIVDAYAHGALVAKCGGIDIVMVHAGHGWLPAQFLSPLNNQRTDQYGGSIENRCRFTMMILERIKEVCGKDFVVDVRISCEEAYGNGLTIDDMVEVAKILEQKADMIHVSASTFHNKDGVVRMYPSQFRPHGMNVPFAAKIKEAVSIPVTVVGAMDDPAVMEDTIASGKADMVAIARGIIADTDLPKKIKEGRADDITPCIRCSYCISQSFVPYVKMPIGAMRCSVNPERGREYEALLLREEPKPKRVCIIGGGPAGMEAAIKAHDLGHQVEIYEKSGQLGGALNLACRPSFKKDVEKFRDVLIRRVEKRKIPVHYNIEATPEMIGKEDFDAVICAIGSRPLIPPIPGLEKAMPASEIYEKEGQIGQQVVMIGGGLVGVEDAIELAMQGKQVTVVEMRPEIAQDAPYVHFRTLQLEIEKYPNLTVLRSTRCLEVEESGVRVALPDGTQQTLLADTVIYATGYLPLSEEAEGFRDTADDFRKIGDCDHMGQILGAVHGGYDAAVSL
ncbi:MAG: FAD-dependent oxidoreductase [Eubacteriales bacterium]|nr:FAD-dependent oxidoreductase [Eubacteriales bacterium]